MIQNELKYPFTCPKCGNSQFIVKFEGVVYYAIADGADGDEKLADITYWYDEVEDYSLDDAYVTKIFCESIDCDWVAPFTTEKEMIDWLRAHAKQSLKPKQDESGTHFCHECSKITHPIDNSLEEHEHQHLQCSHCGSTRLEEVNDNRKAL